MDLSQLNELDFSNIANWPLPARVVVIAIIFIAVLALGYAYLGQLPLVQAAFVGIKAAVIVVVFQALRKVAGKALVGRRAGRWRCCPSLRFSFLACRFR